MRSTVPGPNRQVSGYQLKIELVARPLDRAGPGQGVCRWQKSPATLGDISPLADSETEPPEVPPKVGTPDPEDLRRFIDAAVGKDPQAERHALFLWGHGPELLSDEDPKSVAEDESKKKNSDKPTTY